MAMLHTVLYAHSSRFLRIWLRALLITLSDFWAPFSLAKNKYGEARKKNFTDLSFCYGVLWLCRCMLPCKLGTAMSSQPAFSQWTSFVCLFVFGSCSVVGKDVLPARSLKTRVMPRSNFIFRSLTGFFTVQLKNQTRCTLLQFKFSQRAHFASANVLGFARRDRVRGGSPALQGCAATSRWMPARRGWALSGTEARARAVLPQQSQYVASDLQRYQLCKEPLPSSLACSICLARVFW